MKLKHFILIATTGIFLSGCSSYKKVPYMQDPETVNAYGKEIPLYDAKIMPKDLLYVMVNTTDPQSAAPFNLTMQTNTNIGNGLLSTNAQESIMQYLANKFNPSKIAYIII